MAVRSSPKRRAGIGKRRRRAAAIVELAVVLPLLLAILMGIIEFGWTFMVYQTVANAAREGCRVAVLEGSTEAEVNARINEYMGLTGIANYTVTLVRASEDNPTERVTLSVPYASVSLFAGYFGPTNFNLVSRVSMRKEGAE